MKRKIVLWGANEKDEKILVALHLQDKDGKVNLYTFNEEQATEAFYNKMLNEWREGVDVEFPEGHQVMERPLNMSDDILPESIKVDRTDIISRAKAEWHFVVLSAKLYEMYRTELEDLTDTVENLKQYDNKVWNEMRNFWSKVQEQVQDKNLFRDHASNLKSKTNKLFDKLKGMKKEVESMYEDNSTKYKATVMSELEEIEAKIEKGLGLKPIFEELKSLQSRLKGMKFTKKHRDQVWNKLDGAFKVVKEKRFGDKGQTSNSAVGRLERRYEGLVKAITNMERSIKRDRDDQKFQDRKIATTDGQLEMQIRQAKLKMIEERVKSKEYKLEDMLKTRTELETRIAKEKVKEENPFFIYFGFSHPHDTRDGTPELLAKYGAVNHTDKNSLPPANGKQPELQDNYLEAHPFFHGHPQLRDEERVSGVWKNRDEQTVRNELGREYACSENIDIQLGKVLKKLEAMGELDNTYIVYTSDHGMSIGRHGLMGKQNLYEHTWRVPMIIKGPGLPSGKRIKGNVYLLYL